jgi:hypothetical protein
MARTGKRHSSPEQVQEADKIYEWLIRQRGLAGDVITTSMKLISNEKERADAWFDLSMIVRGLAGVAPGS